jgi:hypothetical protein
VSDSDPAAGTRPLSAAPLTGIDPRGPRFGASITAVLLLITLFLGLVGATVAAVVLAVIVVASFAWGTLAGVQRHPYGLLFRTAVRPRLKPALELEDPTPPRFAQGVGLVITALGLVLQLVGVPYALVVASALAFVAAFLNAAFGYCLGCRIYLLLVRSGLVRSHTATRPV